MAWYWIALVFFAGVANASDLVMKHHVDRTRQENEWFSWWNRDARAVPRKRRELFPESYPMLNAIPFGPFSFCWERG
jgi:hypothetical protein